MATAAVLQKKRKKKDTIQKTYKVAKKIYGVVREKDDQFEAQLKKIEELESTNNKLTEEQGKFKGTIEEQSKKMGALESKNNKLLSEKEELRVSLEKEKSELKGKLETSVELKKQQTKTIEDLTKKMEELEKKNSELRNAEKELRNDFDGRMSKLADEFKMKNDEIENLKKITRVVQHHLGERWKQVLLSCVSADVGKSGEVCTRLTVERFFPLAEVRDVSKQHHSGDFVVTFGGDVKIMLESKTTALDTKTSSLPKMHVERFAEDCCPKKGYDAGVIVFRGKTQRFPDNLKDDEAPKILLQDGSELTCKIKGYDMLFFSSIDHLPEVLHFAEVTVRVKRDTSEMSTRLLEARDKVKEICNHSGELEKNQKTSNRIVKNIKTTSQNLLLEMQQ